MEIEEKMWVSGRYSVWTIIGRCELVVDVMSLIDLLLV